MGSLEVIGRWLMVVGLITIVVGGLLWLSGKFLKIDTFPGTLRFEGSGFTCVFPILLSIILSLVLTLGLNIAARLFHK